MVCIGDIMEDRRMHDLQLQQHTDEELIRYDDLKKEIKELREDVRDLIYAWNQAKGVLTFVKWLLGIAGSISVFIIFIKDHFK